MKEVVTGTLALKVISASSIIAQDRGGTSDPYCIVLLNGVEAGRTKEIEKTVNPVWNQEMNLVLDKVGSIEFHVFDRNSVSSDKKCGEAALAVKSLPNGVPTQLTLNLDTQGTINIQYTFIAKWSSLNTPEEWLGAMHHGCELIKFCSGGKNPHARYFRLDGENSSIIWKSPKKAAHRSTVRIDTIREIRLGRESPTFKKAKEHADKAALSFSILHGPKHQPLDLVANNADEFKFWSEGLKYVFENQSTLVAKVDPRKRWLKQIWAISDKNKDNQLDMGEIMQLLQRLNCQASKREVKKLFNAANTGAGTKHLDFEEFVEFYRQLTYRPELDQLFKDVGKREAGTIQADEFSNFLKNHQGMAAADASALISKHEPTDEGKKGKFLTYDGFVAYLLSSDNALFKSEHSKIYQDMTQPFTHYFISSSHNTYLLGDQLKSDSSVEAYIRALQKGCRCVELDCWDGPDNEPIIYHGHTLTSKILFKDVIKSINEYAFVASPYPVILSIENHCSVPQQTIMAKHMENIFGSKLLKGDPDAKRESYPSPNELKNKIIVKGKRSGSTGQVAGPAGVAPPEDDNDEETDDDEEEETEASKNEEAKKQLKAKHDKKVKLAPELSALVVYCKAVHFKNFDHSIANGKYWEMSSFAEAKTKKLVATQPSKFVEYNKKQMSRIYPAGHRVDSSNYDPQMAWNCGSQIVALNFQTPDRSMQLNQGKFRQNGKCGVILKPACMRNGSFNCNDPSTIPSDVKPVKLVIKLISGQQLPKPNQQAKGEVIDPYVEVEVAGIPKDQAMFKTKVIDNNGFNPIWNETFTFNIAFPELAIVRFNVMDHDNGSKDDFIGQYTVNLTDMRSGYHHVFLDNEFGDELDSASLFILVTLE